MITCDATCYVPKEFGHKCAKPRHPKAEAHRCRCGLSWVEGK